jgi:glycosyltransferase involved in cell wall biosynthesis
MRSALIIVNTVGFDIGNSNSAVANFIREIREFLLTDAKFVVDVTSANSGIEVSAPNLIKDGISLKSLLKKHTPYVYNTLVAYKLKKYQAQQFLKYNKNKYDLIIEFYTVGSELGAKLKKASNASYLLIYDCPVLEQFREMYKSRTLFDPFFLKAEKKSVQSADGIWCYSNYMKEHIKRTYGYEKKFFVSPCIVWKVRHDHQPKINAVRIGFIGSFLVWHKVDLLVQAFNLIAVKYPQAQLLLIGYGQEWPKVNDLVQKSQFKQQIILTGYLKDKELESYKSELTIGVMPGSNWYGSPLKLFEYAQAGIPMIAPSTPVVKDLFIEGESAIFIDENNEIQSITNNIEKLITDKELSRNLAQNAQILMDGRYSRTNQQSEFTKFIDQILSKL